VSLRSRENATDVLLRVVQDTPRPLAELGLGIDAKLSNVIARALEKDVAARYPDVPSFARALVLGALFTGVRLSPDPDPLGLPDWPRWLDEARHTEATGPRVVANTAVRPSTSGAVVVVEESSGSLAALSSERPASRPAGGRALPLVAVLVLLAGAAWFLSRDAAPAATVESQPAAGPEEPAAAAPGDPEPLPGAVHASQQADAGTPRALDEAVPAIPEAAPSPSDRAENLKKTRPPPTRPRAVRPARATVQQEQLHEPEPATPAAPGLRFKETW
jgi:hypothetical protein